MFCGFKPLTIEGLAQAVALDSEGTIDTVVTGSFLLQVCGSFIIVTNSGSVRFAHRSVKEYLMQALLPDCQGFEFSHSNAHAQVAETCLSFLLSFEESSKWARLPTNIHEEAIDLSLTGFEMYACFFWASHCENARTYGSWLRFEHLFDRFVSVRSETIRDSKVAIANTAFQRWISLLWRVFQTDSNLEDSMRHRLEDAISDPSTPLFTACIWGFANKLPKVMVPGGQIVSPRNYRGKSCIYLACENGQDEILDALICSRAIVDAAHVRWGSDLHAAASSGLLTTFVKMLECGAEVNTPEGFYGRTIDAAIRGGNPALVTYALKVGAEVWLPSTAAPIQPRKRRSKSLRSIETSSSETLSEEASVLDDPRQDLVTPIGVPCLGNRDDTPPERYDLLERLRQASLRRRELLNHWRLAKNRAAVNHGASDVVAIMEETSASLTEMGQEKVVQYPLPPGGVSASPTCYYCFEIGYISASPFSWR